MPTFTSYKLKIILLATLLLFGYANITRAQPYVLANFSWANAATDVYIDFDITNSTTYNPPNTVTSGPTNADFTNAYIQAMNEWNSASVFQWFANTSGSDIDPCAGNHNGVKFDLETCSGAFGGTTLAIQLTTFGAGNLATNTVTVFNNNKQWNIYNGSGSGFDFRRVAVHELGHGLGLDHTPQSSNIMYFQSNSTEVPQTGDINGVTAKYGSGGSNDVDGDGISNGSDNCPLDPNNNQLDSDSDGTGNACDLDSDTNDLDADGVVNGADNCPIDPNSAQDDLDSDNIGDACDDDIDGDLIDNDTDNCPTDANNNQGDIDSDTIGDVCDNDADGDGVFNGPTPDVSHEYTTGPLSGSIFSAGPASGNPTFPLLAQTFQAQSSGNLTRVDLPIFCPSGGIELQIRSLSGLQPSSSILSSTPFAGGGTLPANNVGFVAFDLGTPLSISSGTSYAIVVDIASECRMFVDIGSYGNGTGYLGSYANFWSSIGDFRFRTWVDPVPGDNCPLVANPSQADQDNDGVGDACEIADQDSDGVEDSLDNCPAIANPLQENFDGDAQGDACDSDDDNDGLSDAEELTVYSTDPFNSDTDGDSYSDGFEVSVGTNPNLADVNIPVLPFPALLLLWIALFTVGGVGAARAARHRDQFFH